MKTGPDVVCNVEMDGEVVFAATAHDAVGAQGVVIELVGELDTYSAPALQRSLGQLDPTLRLVQLDAARLGFLDSSGLMVLVATMQELAARGCELRVVNPSEAVTQVVRATGLGALYGAGEGSPRPAP